MRWRGVLAVWIGFCLAAGQAAAAAVEVYGRLPAIEKMSLSPSGARLAFIAVDGEKRRLFARQVGGDALAVADIGSAKVRSLQWAGEDHLLLSVSKTVGDRDYWTGERWRAELTAALVMNVNTGKLFRVFKDSGELGGAIGGFYGVRRIDGRWYGFYSGVAQAGDIYRVDLDTGALKQTTFRNADDWVLGAAGELMAHASYDESAKTFRLYTGAFDVKPVLRRSAPLGEVGLVGLGRRPGTVLLSDGALAADRITEVDLATGQTTDLSGEGDRTAIHSPASDLLVGFSGDDGRTVLFDPVKQASFDSVRRAFAKYRVRLISFDEDFRKLIVLTDGDDDAGTFWLVDRSTGKADELDTAYPEVKPADIGPTRWFRYKAADGLPLEAVLTLPPGRKAERLPVVVLPHGGPLDVRDVVGFDWWAQAFAAQGYAVLQPNFRGSSGYGGAFRKAGYKQWGGKMLSDMADGLKALAAEGTVDPARACIVGGSYGGYAALAGVTLQQGLYRCASSYGGVSDVGALMHGEGFGGRGLLGRYLREVMGAEIASDDALRAISPAYLAWKADAPIQLIHGRDDSVVPIAQSDEMEAALRNNGRPVEYVKLDGEDHWLSSEKTRVQTLAAMIAFVRKNNPPN